MILKSIGLMSGTSMDGIDAVLMETDGGSIIRSKMTASLSYSSEFKLQMRQAEFETKQAKKNVASSEIIKKSTELHAQIVKDLLKKANLQAQDIDVIGYHGQSLYHAPKDGITVQIGDGQLLSNLTNITVVNDFRSEDVRNGGQGAPLAPLYHQALAIKDSYFPVAIVNCGGISNISIINGPNEAQVTGFDTGPGNVLIDRYIRNKTSNKEFMDFNGKYGQKGSVNQEVLNKMIAIIQPFLDKDPPKSLDPNEFYLIEDFADLSIYDACATLEALTVKCIVDSVRGEIPTKWILAGGGWNNPVIMKLLKQDLVKRNHLVDIKLASEIGWDNVYMEAEIFAYLAVRSLYKLPITLAKVTGALTAALGGKIYFCQN